MFSVELVPDADIDRAITEDWAALRAAGLPDAGRNPSPSNRPHLTLAVRDHVDTAALGGIADLLPLPLELGGLVLFPHGRTVVVARQVIATAELLALHAAVADRLGPPGARYGHTEVDHWTPHLTLARRLPAERMGDALAAIAAPQTRGAAVGLRVWDAQAKAVTTLR